MLCLLFFSKKRQTATDCSLLDSYNLTKNQAPIQSPLLVQTSREDAAAAAAAALAAQWAPPAQQQGGDAGSLGLDTFIVYHSKSGNMLTPANLGGMRAARPKPVMLLA